MTIRFRQLHSRCTRTKLGLLAATSLSLLATPALAQNAPATTVDELAVFGTRTEGYAVGRTGALGLSIETAKLPASVTVISDDLLEDLGARSLANALPYVAGVSNGDNNGVNTDEFIIRGFPSTNNYINGIRNALTAEGRPSLDTVERVEIVKGPAGVEGSLTSPGGFVNIVTKTPSPTYAAEVFASVGDYNFYRVGADVTGPLAGEALTGRLIATFEDKQQWRPGRKQRPILTLAPSLNWRPVEDTNLLVQYEYRRQNDPLDRGVIFARGIQPDSDFLPRDFSFHQEVDELKLTNQRFDIDLTQAFSEILSGRLHYQEIRQRDRQIATRNADSEGGGTLFLSDGLTYSGNPLMPIYTSDGGSRLTAKIYVAELKADFAAGGANHAVNLGASTARNTDIFGSRTGDYTYLDGVTTIDVTNPTDQLTRDQLGIGQGSTKLVYANFIRGDRIDSVYGQWLGRWTDRLRTVASVRQDKVDIFAREGIEGIDPVILDQGVQQGSINPNNLFSDLYSERTLSWRLAASYDLSDTLTGFAGTSHSAEPQSGFMRQGGGVGAIDNRSLEAGLKFKIADGRALATLTAYTIERSNIAIADPANTPSESFLVPLGSAQIHGLELEVAGKLTNTVSVFGGVSIQDSEITESDSPIIGNEFANVPKRQASVFVNWNAGNVGLPKLDIGLGVVHQGRRQANSANEYQLPAYTRVDLGVSYQLSETLEARVQVNNLFDETYYTAAQDSIFGSDQVGVGDRRLMQLTLTADF